MTPQTTSKISNELITKEMPSKTYKVDFDRKVIDREIDGVEALKQAVYFILNTIRYENIIYSHNYGSEVNNAIGLDIDLAKVEIERYVKEAILADDRFSDIQNYVIEKNSSDSMRIYFDVVTNIGLTIAVEKEVSI